MRKLSPLWHSQEKISKTRIEDLEAERSKLDPVDQAEEHAHLSAFIDAEKELLELYSSRSATYKAERKRKAWSVSPKGFLELFALTIFVFIFMAIKKHYFG